VRVSAQTNYDSFIVAENHTSIGSVVGSDPDDGFTFAITGGVDGGLFSINPNSGALSFNNAPDFETPDDAGQDHTYDLIVTVTDSFGPSDQQSISSVTETTPWLVETATTIFSAVRALTAFPEMPETIR